ncbi:MAG: hypothetical protein AAF889_06730, partial [Cyanobacteria bacterium P01_D01_bin.73]
MSTDVIKLFPTFVKACTFIVRLVRRSRITGKEFKHLACETIAYNQNRTLVFNYEINQRHKALKDSLKDFDIDTSTPEEILKELEKKDIAKLRSLYDALTSDLLEHELKSIFNRNFLLMERAYKPTPFDKKNIRFCIKLIRPESGQNGSDIAIDLHRKPSIYSTQPFFCRESTAFATITDHDKDYFICNDIPKD